MATLTGNITAGPDALRRHALHAERLREGAERRDPHDPARHQDRRRHPRSPAARSGSCAAPRSTPRHGGRADRLHLGAAPGNRKPGDWGGIIIIGNGIINRTGDPILTEGGAAGQPENYAGGTDNDDNSGTLRYVRIEFAGYDVSNGAGQELNTPVQLRRGPRHHLRVHRRRMAGLDDSFECWGGAVDGRYLVSYESGDDHFDWTEGYQGRNQFLIAFQTQPARPGAGHRRALDRPARASRATAATRHRLRPSTSPASRSRRRCSPTSPSSAPAPPRR